MSDPRLKISTPNTPGEDDENVIICPYISRPIDTNDPTSVELAQQSLEGMMNALLDSNGGGQDYPTTMTTPDGTEYNPHSWWPGMDQVY